MTLNLAPPKVEARSLPCVTIRPTSGWQMLNLKEIWLFRDLLWTLAVRDLKLRYRQTVLGVVWVVLQPLLGAIIFAFVFGKVAKLPSEGIPYVVFAYAGLLGWNVFSSTLTKASTCLVHNAGLISKVYFPRLVLPLSTIYGSLVDFSVALALMGGLMVAFHILPSARIILLPVWLFFISLLALGLGLFSSALMVSYRDIQHVLPVALQFLLYASPIAYALSSVPPHLRGIYSLLNPLVSLLEAFRWSLLNVGSLDITHLSWACFLTIGVFIGGAFSFKRMERRFADVI